VQGRISAQVHAKYGVTDEQVVAAANLGSSRHLGSSRQISAPLGSSRLTDEQVMAAVEKFGA